MRRLEGSDITARDGGSAIIKCGGGPLPSEATETQGSSQPRKNRTRRRRNRRRHKTEATENTDVERSVQDGEGNKPSPDRTAKQQAFGEGQIPPSREPSLQELLSENCPYIDPDDDDFDEKFVYTFMTKGEDGRRRLNKANFVDSVCPPIIIQKLLANPSSGPLRKVCFVDDRTNDGTKSISLGDRVPLTVQELYQKLREKVKPRCHADLE
ncbi:hypothetical protein FOMA001_g18462 [Fusarium oxysporum f. sp. matthiolae]|nr:hypothetical protein FOMA001_g18462 [Fusarium oxysporum f. sp. matthiolae]